MRRKQLKIDVDNKTGRVYRCQINPKSPSEDHNVQTTIERMKFTPGPVPDERAELARQAKNVLGYKRMAQAFIAEDGLMFTLRKLEIEPLVLWRVRQYMFKKAQPGPWGSTIEGLYFFAISIALWMSLFLLSPSGPHAWDGPSLLNILTVVVGIIAGIFDILGFVGICSNDGRRTTREWKVFPVADYEGVIPDFALNKAIQIKKELPQAQLYVEALMETKERRLRRSPDPFLLAILGDERCYIDVWDENEYEATL